VEGAQISAWKRTELVDRVKDLKKQIINYEKLREKDRITKLKADAVERIETGQVQNPEVLLLDAGSNNKVLNEILKIYGKQSKNTHVLLFSADAAANKVLCLAQTPKVRTFAMTPFLTWSGLLYKMLYRSSDPVKKLRPIFYQ